MRVQMVIIGGGIAGLWTLRRAIALGYNAILLEKDAIGSGQTLGAQGILHSGLKYGLDGANRDIATLLRSLPPRWLACFERHGELDLSTARIHTKAQHLWAANSWLDKIAASVGARAMQGEVRNLPREAWPAALRDGSHQGSVYEIVETVVEVKSVCQALAAPVRERIFRAAIGDMDIAPDGAVRAVIADGLRLEADVFIFTAATGNEAVAAMLGFGKDAAQRRPLRQIMVRGRLPLLYGHGVTVSPKPIVTITSHPLDSDTVWYLGGGIAESAPKLTHMEAVANASRTLQNIFPKLDWPTMQWAVWDVDRAEPHAASRLPDGPALLERANAAICWPTKLVYAPALAELALAFAQRIVQPTEPGPVKVALPLAEVGTFPWETAQWHSVV